MRYQNDRNHMGILEEVRISQHIHAFEISKRLCLWYVNVASQLINNINCFSYPYEYTRL